MVETKAKTPRVDVGSKLTPRAGSGRVRVELLTDPWSVWCWGFEPVRRTLQLRYPQVDFRFLLGGMFPQMPKPEEAGFDLNAFFGTVHRTTGMPVRTDFSRRDAPTSTFPACVHVHAVSHVAPQKEDAYLRALREAVYLDGLNINHVEVGADIAQRVGIDRAAFMEARASPEVKSAFEQRIKDLHRRNLHAYPTLLFTVGDKTSAVEGFQGLPAVLGIVQTVTGRVQAPSPDPPWQDIIVPGERVLTREVAEVWGISVEAAYDRLRELEKKGELVRDVHGHGIAWSRKGTASVSASFKRPKAVRVEPAP